jgi:hypothetical protein
MNPKNGSHGGVINKLLFRTLPEYFPENSVYAHFPLMHPPAMRTYLTKQGVVDQYDFKRATIPPPVKTVESYAGLKAVLGDIRERFRSPYDENMRLLTKGNRSEFSPAQQMLACSQPLRCSSLFISTDGKARSGNDRKLVCCPLLPSWVTLNHVNTGGQSALSTWCVRSSCGVVRR